VHHATVDEYLAYRAAFGPLPIVPEARRDEYRATLRMVSKAWAMPDGSLDLDWKIAVLRTRKPR
jgi:hypothetical protein